LASEVVEHNVVTDIILAKNEPIFRGCRQQLR
jgi:hypothetical protein